MIINLTQHRATEEQARVGVYDGPEWFRQRVSQLLTFESLPERFELVERAERLAQLAYDQADKQALEEDRIQEVMIGGAPYLMAHLERALVAYGLTPVYAFSHRVSVEKTLPDGRVEKVSQFSHAGFVWSVRGES